MVAPAPTYRSQGNRLFRTDAQNAVVKRGQEVPYDINGSPTIPPPEPEPGTFSLWINNLPLAPVGVPLFRTRLTHDMTITVADSTAEAGTAATGAPVMDIRKDGVSVGDITWAGTVGTLTLSDSTWLDGDLFDIYPPSPADATLDQVALAFATD